jgi:RNA polymerase sigma-70 factor (ECF subfamily)
MYPFSAHLALGRIGLDLLRTNAAEPFDLFSDRSDRMSASSFSKNDSISAIPILRAFAVLLSGSPDHAEDPVQKALFKGWLKMGQFDPVTFLHARLITILRNSHFSGYRRKAYGIDDSDASAQPMPVFPISTLTLRHFRSSLSGIAQGFPLQRRPQG